MAGRDRERAELVARTVDSVQAGVDEQEKAHALEAKSTNRGFFQGQPYRGSRWAAASFSYRLRLASASSPRVTYWGGKSRRFRLELLVDGAIGAVYEVRSVRPASAD